MHGIGRWHAHTHACRVHGVDPRRHGCSVGLRRDGCPSVGQVLDGGLDALEALVGAEGEKFARVHPVRSTQCQLAHAPSDEPIG